MTFTIRNLWRNKLRSAINVLGLAIGLSACLTMGLIVAHELGFDTFRTDIPHPQIKINHFANC